LVLTADNSAAPARAGRLCGMTTKTLSRTASAYVSVVILAGALAVAASVAELLSQPLRSEWLILAALTILSGSATVRLPSVAASLSVSEAFVFTSVLLFGAPAGTLTVALDGLIISLWLSKRRRELYRVLFNMAAPSVSIWIAAQLFFAQANITPLYQAPLSTELRHLLLPLATFAVTSFLLNSSLIAIAVSLESGQSAFSIWRTNFLWLSLNFFCGASVASLITVYPRRDPTAVGAILPLLLVLYLTYRTSMARVADATQHLVQMNDMYLATIETLATAVDAKDQVTHGHIRRVQSYAVALANVLGIRDPGLIQAIKAASLLHDMGKLAVPEHILNKPGKLTAPEFERMKSHAGIGADILSSIKFPYPVIPIVRHHHENWDGSGYPHGLKGTDIPVGARILSVVDCFDALTSDRPYRRKLSDEEAIDILLQRRGSMYDPLIVDSFIGIVRQAPAVDAEPNAEDQATAIELSRAIAANTTSVPSAARALAPSAEFAEAFELCRTMISLIARRGLSDPLQLAINGLAELVRGDLFVVYAHDPKSDQLLPTYLSRNRHIKLASTPIPVGQRLTGWVAANRAPVLNADPALDYGDSPSDHLDQFRSVLCVPLALGEILMGVLCVYSESPGHFSRKDQQTCEIISGQLALMLAERLHRPGTHAVDAA
jgi:putative nucleotidyltransferase with HDIG domain